MIILKLKLLILDENGNEMSGKFLLEQNKDYVVESVDTGERSTFSFDKYSAVYRKGSYSLVNVVRNNGKMYAVCGLKYRVLDVGDYNTTKKYGVVEFIRNEWVEKNAGRYMIYVRGGLLLSKLINMKSIVPILINETWLCFKQEGGELKGYTDLEPMSQFYISNREDVTNGKLLRTIKRRYVVDGTDNMYRVVSNLNKIYLEPMSQFYISNREDVTNGKLLRTIKRRYVVDGTDNMYRVVSNLNKIYDNFIYYINIKTGELVHTEYCDRLFKPDLKPFENMLLGVLTEYKSPDRIPNLRKLCRSSRFIPKSKKYLAWDSNTWEIELNTRDELFANGGGMNRFPVAKIGDKVEFRYALALTYGQISSSTCGNATLYKIGGSTYSILKIGSMTFVFPDGDTYEYVPYFMRNNSISVVSYDRTEVVQLERLSISADDLIALLENGKTVEDMVNLIESNLTGIRQNVVCTDM